MSDQDQVSGDSLTGDQDIVWSDASSGGIEDCTYLGGATSVVDLEIDNFKCQPLNDADRSVGMLAVERAETQLVHRDGRQPDIL
jgi:hypothetical protein